MGGFGSGDRLARGAKSANFGSMSHVSAEKWNEIFGERPLNISKPTKQPKRQNKNAANQKTSN